MADPELRRQGSEAFRSRFRWVGGHADVWRAFHDGPTLARLVNGLAEPWLNQRITAVAGVEARGFLLGGAVAVKLGVGFRAVRKEGALFPGPKVFATADQDYRGNRHRLAVQEGLLTADRVLMVDDWAERGSQALAAQELVQRCGASFAGLTVLVDQLSEPVRRRLGRVTSLVLAEELAEPDASLG